MEIRNCCDLGKTKNESKKFIYLFVYQYSNPTKRGLLASSVKTSKQNK